MAEKTNAAETQNTAALQELDRRVGQLEAPMETYRQELTQVQAQTTDLLRFRQETEPELRELKTSAENSHRTLEAIQPWLDALSNVQGDSEIVKQVKATVTAAATIEAARATNVDEFNAMVAARDKRLEALEAWKKEADESQGLASWIINRVDDKLHIGHFKWVKMAFKCLIGLLVFYAILVAIGVAPPLASFWGGSEGGFSTR